MTDLTSQKCVPCEGGVEPLSTEAAKNLISQLHEDWQLREDSREISRTYRFKNYYRTIGFVNALAWIAHAQDHHPDLEVGYNRCLVRYSTHAIGGLSQNDFICAAKIDALID